MNSASLRRLASERRSLHTAPLPPNYLLPASRASEDDLTQLTLLLAGPQGTPYAKGLWRLQLRFPDDYPCSPPKASFRTRIWHPNVEEVGGSVCVDTLKRDWRKELTVRDVLVTISCLLIHPNPDSALNASAGQLLQEDYEAFARQARLMTSIHAVVPRDLRDAAAMARRRGDEASAAREDDDERPVAAGSTSSASSVVMKHPPPRLQPGAPDQTDDVDEDEQQDEDQENDPSLSPSPVTIAPMSPRRNILGKRPLSALPTPVDPDAEPDAVDDYFDAQLNGDTRSLSPSERNIANNTGGNATISDVPRKSPKLSERGTGVNASGRLREDGDDTGMMGVTVEDAAAQSKTTDTGKENVSEAGIPSVANARRALPAVKPPAAAIISNKAKRPSPATSASSSIGSAGGRSGSGASGRPRVGLRRL